MKVKISLKSAEKSEKEKSLSDLFLIIRNNFKRVGLDPKTFKTINSIFLNKRELKFEKRMLRIEKTRKTTK